MKKFLTTLLFMSITLTACGKSNEKVTIDSLQQLSFEEIDKKIEAKETMVVYFGWIENCGDSKNFQDNYLSKKLEEETSFSNIYIVNLDAEIPDALFDHDLRQPMEEKYGVGSSPTLVHYVDGEVVDQLSWNTLNSSDTTGIIESELNMFFIRAGLLKEK